MKLTTKYISVILLGLILINTFSLSLVKFHYELNKDYIVANYCINTEKPELACEGQCHLDKILDIVNNDSKNEEPANTVNLNFITTEFFFTISSHDFQQITTPNTLCGYYSNNYSFISSSTIEKPPIHLV